MRALHRVVRQAAVGLSVLMLLASAEAHAVYQGAGDFYAGMLHPLTSPEHVLPMLVLGALAGQNGLKRCEFVLWAFPAAMAAGACTALSVPDLRGVLLFNVVSAVLLGSLLAAAFTLQSWLILSQLQRVSIQLQSVEMSSGSTSVSPDDGSGSAVL